MSLYRNAVWFAKGLCEYTKGGYETASKHFNPADLEVDCKGKSFMITGANSGIGKCVALEIARRGGKIHMVCRNGKTAEEAKKEIEESTGNKDIHVHLLDLSEPKAVYDFGTQFAQSEPSLTVLINNAGCMINERKVKDDLEQNFATNTLATHILTQTLIPVLSKAEKPRVIVVSSGGMLVQKLNVDDLQFEKLKPFDGTMAYAQNKRQQIIMTEQYAQQFPQIHFSSMHPGWAATPAVQQSMPDFYSKMKNRLRTPEQGADTVLWLAVSEAALKHSSGLFFQDRVPVLKHLPLAWTHSTPAEDKKLMDFLENVLAKFTTA